jgi:hypothetical protein
LKILPADRYPNPMRTRAERVAAEHEKRLLARQSPTATATEAPKPLKSSMAGTSSRAALESEIRDLEREIELNAHSYAELSRRMREKEHR